MGPTHQRPTTSVLDRKNRTHRATRDLLLYLWHGDVALHAGHWDAGNSGMTNQPLTQSLRKNDSQGLHRPSNPSPWCLLVSAASSGTGSDRKRHRSRCSTPVPAPWGFPKKKLFWGIVGMERHPFGWFLRHQVVAQPCQNEAV